MSKFLEKQPVKKLAIPVVAVGLMAASAGSTAAGAERAAATDTTTAAGAAAGTATPRHQHSIRTYRARGTYTCGDLRLRVTGGRETEETDGDLRNGIVHVSTSRVDRHLVLAGSDGRTYRASSVVVAWDILHAPDFKHPTTGLEVIQVVFRGGPTNSPGWLREKIRFVNGHETDVVHGPCHYAE